MYISTIETEDLEKLRNYLESGEDIDTGDILMFFQENGIALINEVLRRRKADEIRSNNSIEEFSEWINS